MKDLSYTIYEPIEPQKELVARADELIFVKDGFSFWAMTGSVFWMIYHHLWIPLIGFIVAIGLLTGLAHLFGGVPGAGGILFVGLSIALGFLANDIRRAVLERQQYQMIGAIAGHSKIECERRFFSHWSSLQKVISNEANI
ncbi:MAG: DUF2628 domain-containing protein [bacterium]|nr:DUF2628 domain-containing protein [bacterium]